MQFIFPRIFWPSVFVMSLALSGCHTKVAGVVVGSNALSEAEEAFKAGKFDIAIALYEEHIRRRTAIDDRPSWENPKFYLIFIGDIEVSRGDIAAALKRYEEAEASLVSRELIADRYRSVARWYEEHNRLEEAFEVLKKYRERDPLLFDAMLDRIAKEISRREDEGK